MHQCQEIFANSFDYNTQITKVESQVLQGKRKTSNVHEKATGNLILKNTYFSLQ